MSHYELVAQRSFIGRPPSDRRVRIAPRERRTSRPPIGFPLSAKVFDTYRQALKWARAFAHESCHLHHRWEIERVGSLYAIGIYSENTGKREGWAE